MPPFLSFKIITKKARESKAQMDEKKWGGKRTGAGRPKGSTNAVRNPRPARWVSAYDDEWKIIKEFISIVKQDKSRAERILKTE